MRRVRNCELDPRGRGRPLSGQGGRHPPPLAELPALWGSAERVGELFDGTGIELEYELDVVEMRFESIGHAVEEFATSSGLS